MNRNERVIILAIATLVASLVMARWANQLAWWMRAHVDQYQTEIDTREHTNGNTSPGRPLGGHETRLDENRD